jgi:AraC-like DNA-binding protein
VKADVAITREDSELGHWTAGLWQPPHLAPWVESFWYSEGTTGAARERLLPNGLLELAVCLGEPHRLIVGRGSETLRSCISGLQTSAMVIEHPSWHRVLGLRLHPAGAYALLPQPMSEVSNYTVDLADVLGTTAIELADRCHAASTIEDCFARAAAWVRERVCRARGFDPEIAWVAARITDSGGRVPIAALREQTGLSKTRLAALFREQIGVPPKVYARVVRFRRALALLDAEPSSLAAAALDAGYYDQSHMTTEFRELGGLTPREFLRQRYPGGTAAAEG